MAHGFGAPRAHRLYAYAESFARRIPRGGLRLPILGLQRWTGAPRSRHHRPTRRLAHAIAFARTLPGPTRIRSSHGAPRSSAATSSPARRAAKSWPRSSFEFPHLWPGQLSRADPDRPRRPRHTARGAATKMPHATVREYDLGHLDLYLEPAFPTVVADQLSFLNTAVPAGQALSRRTWHPTSCWRVGWSVGPGRGCRGAGWRGASVRRPTHVRVMAGRIG